MLGLLRKLRHKLLAQGRLRAYLIYAVGEILLVMVGILLALQVNNWNQKRIETNKELKALVDLSKEFQLNKQRINAKQNLRQSIESKFDDYVELISTEQAGYQTYKDIHTAPFLFGMTNPSHGVIDALISSGEIALISNDSLKYYLADWKNQAENLYENEQILWESGFAYIRSSTDKLLQPSYEWKDADTTQLNTAFNDLKADVAYRNNLVGFIGTNKVVIAECNTVLSLLDEILFILDAEIKKSSM